MTNYGTLETRIEKLETAILRLEKLTRDCHKLAEEYWKKGDRESKTFRSLEDKTAEKIAVCIAEILYEESGRVFVAPRYRPRAKISDENLKPAYTDFEKFAEDFGQLAEGGLAGANPVPPTQFMPVAFWNYHIYEKPIVILGPDGNINEVKISGFAGWTKDHFLGQSPNYSENPIFGFHFSLTDISESKPSGLLHFKIPQSLTPSEITEYFLSECNKKVKFYGGPEKEIDFPVITGVKNLPEPNAESIVKTIFSTLFYSNFKRSDLNNYVLAGGKELNIELCNPENPLSSTPKAYKSIMDAATYLYNEYYAYTHQAGDTDPLAFHHYYAFMLNPSINFGNNDGAAIGTVNVYTDIQIPTLHTALIRKHIESIYHLLREIEDWEEATIKGAYSAFVHIDDALGHEVTKVYSTAYSLLDSSTTDSKQLSKNFILNEMVMMALQYGMLWGNTSSASIPPETQLWSNKGLPTLHAKYIPCLARESWGIFLASEVFRGITFNNVIKDLNDISFFWEYPVSSFLKHEEKAYFELEDKLKRQLAERNQVPTHRQQLSRAIYRFLISIMSNMWKHLALSFSNDHPTFSFMSMEQRLECVKKLLDCFQGKRMLPSVSFLPDNLGCKIELSNPCELPTQSLSNELRGTSLVMALAGQEIWKIQGIKASLDEIKKQMHFSYTPLRKCWISSLVIPRLLVKTTRGEIR